MEYLINKDIEVEVLIVGAGPVGMLLALLLKQKNINVLVIDKRMASTTLPRAIAINQASLEILNQFGLVDSFIHEAMVISETNILWDKKIIGKLDFCNIKTKYPYFFHFPQNKLELYMEKLLIDKNILLFRGLCLQEINKLDFSYLSIANTENNQAYKIKSQVVVGADGGNSTVRNLIDVKLSTEFYNSYFMVFDVVIKENVFDKNRYFFNDDGYCMVVPKSQNSYRVIISSEENPTLIVPENIILVDFLQKIIYAKTNLDLHIVSIDWYTHSEFGHKYAEQIYKDNIILAGDAMHQFSPIGGTNMNFGLQDAMYLGNILPLMIKDSSINLLDQYALDRITNMHKQILITREFTKILATKNNLNYIGRIKLYKSLLQGNIAEFLTGEFEGINNNVA